MSVIVMVYVYSDPGPMSSGLGCDVNMARGKVLVNRTVSSEYCNVHSAETQPNAELAEQFPPSNGPSAIRFMVLGDFGRDGFCCQRDVALEMARASSTVHAQFVVNVGDAFYEYGLETPHQEQVDTSWRQVYGGTHKSLAHLKWYSVLGNHEYRGSVQAVLDIPNHVTDKFVIKDRFYDHVFQSGDGSVTLHMFFLDTSPMINAYRTSGYDDPQDTMLHRSDGIATQWSRVQEQLDWLERELDRSTADVKIVVGHHPPFTSGAHFNEDDGFLRGKLSPILEKHQVSAYFGGHDHNLQEYWQASQHTRYFVSAGGSKVEAAFTRRDKYLRYFEQINGFCVVEVHKQHVHVVFVDRIGRVRKVQIYQT